MRLFRLYAKKTISTIFGPTRLKKLHFYFRRFIYFSKNKRFKRENPESIIPPDFWLYETFQLDYQNYIQDGKLAAKEIIEWISPFITNTPINILDWGCGTGRIIQHLQTFAPDSNLFGADISKEIINWNQKQYPQIQFNWIPDNPPTEFQDLLFDCIYGISVFTHIPIENQEAWINELYRILKFEGVLLLTTMGEYFYSKLTRKELNQLIHNGIFENVFNVNNIRKPGDRNYSVYVTETYFRNCINDKFKVLHYFNGKTNPEKFGGQDVWLLQKKHHFN